MLKNIFSVLSVETAIFVSVKYYFQYGSYFIL